MHIAKLLLFMEFNISRRYFLSISTKVSVNLLLVNQLWSLGFVAKRCATTNSQTVLSAETGEAMQQN